MSNGLPATRIILPILLLLTLLMPVALADEASPMIRVGLTRNFAGASCLTLCSSQKFQIKHGDSAPTSVSAGARVEIALRDGAIVVSLDGTESLTSTDPIRLEPGDNEQVFEILAPEVRDRKYRGTLEVTPGAKLSVVNELDIEHYVYGVVPVEVPETFHAEAQKAFALAARTYVLRNAKHKADGFNICDSTHCQGYCGASKDSEWVRRAVDGTRGQVIAYNDRPISAAYSADCGGVTKSAADYSSKKNRLYFPAVVDNPSGQRSVVTPRPEPSPSSGEGDAHRPDTETPDYCAKSPHHLWTLAYTADELATKLKAWQPKIGKLTAVEFKEFDNSDRVKRVLLKGDAGECTIAGDDLRDALGHSTLKSTRAVISASSDGKFTITGSGFGHGLGMCAYGADGMARSKEGVTCADIIKHYYPGVEVKQISDLK